MLGPIYALRQKPVLWAALRKSGTLATKSNSTTTTSPPTAPVEAGIWGFLNSSLCTGLGEGTVLSASPNCHLCSQNPQVLHKPFENAEKEDSGLGHAQKKKITTSDMWSNSFLPFPERSWKLGVSSQSYSTLPRVVIMAKGYLEFSYQLWCGWFHTSGVQASQLVSKFLTKKTVLCMADLVSLLKKGGSRACYSTILPTSCLFNTFFRWCIW